jgi:hypothetical protein
MIDLKALRCNEPDVRNANAHGLANIRFPAEYRDFGAREKILRILLISVISKYIT